jgi:hypothetical protein
MSKHTQTLGLLKVYGQLQFIGDFITVLSY